MALARAAVERSFAAHNALVVESAMPDAEDVNSPVSTVGSRLEEDFRAIGMGKYIRIVPPSTPAVRFTTDGYTSRVFDILSENARFFMEKFLSIVTNIPTFLRMLECFQERDGVFLRRIKKTTTIAR